MAATIDGGRRRSRIELSIVDYWALLMCLVMVFLAAFGSAIWGEAANEMRLDQALAPISSEHWMGTDQLGRDIFLRTLVATRASVASALAATVIGAILGIALGAFTALTRGVLKTALSGLIGILVAFPGTLIAIFFAVVFGLGSMASILAIGAAFVPNFARLTQTLASSLVSQDYVQYPRTLGKSYRYIAVKHLLPNAAEPLLVYGATHLGFAIMAMAGLGFLGLGAQPPSYDWGSMLGTGIRTIFVAPGTALGPALAIAVAALSFNIMGERVADVVAGRSRKTSFDLGIEARMPALSETAPADPEHSEPSALEVRQLQVLLQRDGEPIFPVRELSLRVGRAQAVGIVGETGSGKSVAARAISQLIEHPGVVTAKRLELDGRPVTEMSQSELGQSVAMVMQDPSGSFNPSLRIGSQMIEPLMIHLGIEKKEATRLAEEALENVGIDHAPKRMRQYQHEFSGGMKQRAAIATALLVRPGLLILDEPTTALDVTVQRQILDLVADLRTKHDVAVIFISHDLAVVANVCDRVVVMYAGFVVEEGTVDRIVNSPRHPYTHALLQATPHMDSDRSRPLYAIDGRVPGPEVDIKGCAFAPRCPRAQPRCWGERPPLEGDDSGSVACWYPIEDPRLAAPRQEGVERV